MPASCCPSTELGMIRYLIIQSEISRIIAIMHPPTVEFYIIGCHFCMYKTFIYLKHPNGECLPTLCMYHQNNGTRIERSLTKCEVIWYSTVRDVRSARACINPLTAKLFNWNFYQLEVVSR